MERMKACTKCGEMKPLSAFSKHRLTKDGYAYQCKECNKKRANIWRTTPSGIYTVLKAQSKFYNKGEMDFTRKEFKDWYNAQPKKCVYCDMPEELINGTGDLWNNKMIRLQIDRIIPRDPYVKGNMVLACPRCNMIKSDYFTFDEMREIAQKYVKPKWKIVS